MQIRWQQTFTRTSPLLRFSLTHPLASSGALRFVPRIKQFFFGGKSCVHSGLRSFFSALISAVDKKAADCGILAR